MNNVCGVSVYIWGEVVTGQTSVGGYPPTPMFLSTDEIASFDLSASFNDKTTVTGIVYFTLV